jgi:hypothetical protein
LSPYSLTVQVIGCSLSKTFIRMFAMPLQIA